MLRNAALRLYSASKRLSGGWKAKSNDDSAVALAYFNARSHDRFALVTVGRRSHAGSHDGFGEEPDLTQETQQHSCLEDKVQYQHQRLFPSVRRLACGYRDEQHNDAEGNGREPKYRRQ